LDFEGGEALDITIVLKRRSADKISGDSALALREAREERFPIISFVIGEELEWPSILA